MTICIDVLQDALAVSISHLENYQSARAQYLGSTARRWGHKMAAHG